LSIPLLSFDIYGLGKKQGGHKAARLAKVKTGTGQAKTHV